MRLTFRHLLNARKQFKPGDVRSDDYFNNHDGRVTIQYPLEAIPIPDHGRYRLNNEMDDCIVCDKCAKVCPVDCIDIEPIKATEEVGKASDGSPIRLYAARFDIDMAKCCYCGLCTTVCPTECLTMTKTFDYSELDVRDMVYHYANLSPEEAQEKQHLLEQFQKEKEAQKLAAKASVPSPAETVDRPTARPVFKPGMKSKPPVEAAADSTPVVDEPKPKPAFRPGLKPKPPVSSDSEGEVKASTEEKPVGPAPFKPSMKPKATDELAKPITDSGSKSAFRPTMKPKVGEEQTKPAEEPVSESPKHEIVAKPTFRPTMKPKGTSEPTKSVEPPVFHKSESDATSDPAFRPTMKPKAAEETVKPAEEPVSEIPESETVAKPAFRPTMKPKSIATEENLGKTQSISDPEASPKAKPSFRPTMKPKPKEGND